MRKFYLINSKNKTAVSIKNFLKIRLNKTQKWVLFIVLVILYFTLLYIFEKDRSGKDLIYTIFFDSVVWPVIFYCWIFGTRNEYDISSIYFKKEKYDDIVSDLQSMGFYKYKESSSKVKFRNKDKWWRRHRIFIYKHENGIWELDAKNRFIKNLEKYMVRYSRL